MVALIGAGIPSLVAVLIFFKWKNQKGSEVIANEAKQMVKDLLEQIKLIMFMNEGRYEIEEHEEQFLKFKALFEKSVIDITYVEDCIYVKELELKFRSYTKHGNEIIKLKSKNTLDFDNPNFIDKLKTETKKFSEFAMDLVNLLKPYSIYHKDFKFKDK
ncbi:hypothetical protein [Acinetobacter bereziniae]|uniref:hypothetical protein n=1 Tax=Acinetobacter bereziniae TaxID=106648 RepID=UPI00125E9FE8|nr:hypothetical protein [Acinetobacter bereziniae]MDM1783385.1 hypothetical protein [Acinetobacter bereziniae]